MHICFDGSVLHHDSYKFWQRSETVVHLKDCPRPQPREHLEQKPPFHLGCHLEMPFAVRFDALPGGNLGIVSRQHQVQVESPDSLHAAVHVADRAPRIPVDQLRICLVEGVARHEDPIAAV